MLRSRRNGRTEGEVWLDYSFFENRLWKTASFPWFSGLTYLVPDLSLIHPHVCFTQFHLLTLQLVVCFHLTYENFAEKLGKKWSTCKSKMAVLCIRSFFFFITAQYVWCRTLAQIKSLKHNIKKSTSAVRNWAAMWEVQWCDCSNCKTADWQLWSLIRKLEQPHS